jgi:hypothetical protein
MKELIIAGQRVGKRQHNEIVIEGDRAHIVIYNRQGEPVIFTTIDSSDVPQVRHHSWYLDKKGYVLATPRAPAGSSRRQVKLYLHNVFFPPRDGLVVDHINRNPLDNRRGNLRYATFQLNRLNADKVSGITYHAWRDTQKTVKRKSPWKATIYLSERPNDRGRRHLGYFKTKDDAIRARQEAVDEYFATHT